MATHTVLFTVPHRILYDIILLLLLCMLYVAFYQSISVFSNYKRLMFIEQQRLQY